MTENPPTPEAGKDGNNISRLTSAQETFELFTKIFVVVAAVLYVTGFLVVSLHLARYGIHSFSMLRAQYILAGAWFFAHILFFVPIATLLRYLESLYIAKHKDSSPEIMGVEKQADIEKRNLAWLVLLSVLLLSILFSHGISIFKYHEMFTLILYGLMNVIILLYGYSLWNKRSVVQKSNYLAFGQFLIACILLLTHINHFSNNVYSKISAEYGGGMPVKVQFHWRDECKTKDIAATFQKECKLKEEPVYFDQILATDTDHVIISPCPKIYPRTFEISNDLIDYVEIKYGQKEDIEL